MRKAATAIGLGLVILLAIPIGCDTVVSHYRSWQASKLLATVRGLHPGTSTESEVNAALKPFSYYEHRSESQHQGILVRRIDYQFFNSTGWTGSLAYHLRFLPFRITLPWTMFEVSVEFEDGLLAEMHVIEMQEDQPGYPHPNSASVTVLPTRLDPLLTSLYGPLPTDFNGYSEYSRTTGQLDENQKWTTFICCHARFITLDERATPDQFSRSMNFQLHCLTSVLRCKDDRQILP
jgi:hypothetical protein